MIAVVVVAIVVVYIVVATIVVSDVSISISRLTNSFENRKDWKSKTFLRFESNYNDRKRNYTQQLLESS